MLPLDQMKTMTFSITPVLFNVGINEKATLAHKMGLNAPQEKNNIDNFKALAEYYRRYKKLHLNTASSKNGKSKYHVVFSSPFGFFVTTLTYLIVAHKKPYLIVEHVGILMEKNKQTCKNLSNKQTC